MGDPIIISDEDKTPQPSLSKKRRSDPQQIETVLISDSDPTPQKPSNAASTPSFVAETPMSVDVSVVKCSIDPGARFSNSQQDDRFSGKRIISLESEFESEPESSSRQEGMNVKNNEPVDFGEPERGWFSRLSELSNSLDNDDHTQVSAVSSNLEDDISQVDCGQEKEKFCGDQKSDTPKPGRKPDAKSIRSNAPGKRKMTKEERIRAMEEKKLKKEQEKLQRAASKAEAAELKRFEKEKRKWEKGKFALKSIVAEIDAKVVEQGSVGGHLLSRFSDKGITFHITSNPIERSIVWKMTVPERIAQLLPQGPEIPYVLLVYEASEFCDLVTRGQVLDDVSRIQSQYPSFTVCYVINRLMAYINKREKEEYKNPENSGWRRPPVEEVLAKLTTHYARVRSRLCADEAELAENVVGLTCSLASCQYRKKLTRLSVNANGSMIPKDAVDRDLLKKSPWLKALIAIPKVQPRFALAVWKKYPTMKSLLRVYMDPEISVHDKEFLLKDLTVGGLTGGSRRLGEVCSKRIYRVLMAQSGSIKTDDVEFGADFFASAGD